MISQLELEISQLEQGGAGASPAEPKPSEEVPADEPKPSEAKRARARSSPHHELGREQQPLLLTGPVSVIAEVEKKEQLEGGRRAPTKRTRKWVPGVGWVYSGGQGGAEGGAEGGAAEEEELEYVIECVLEQRKQGRTTKYLVKWKGYEQAKEITWEPATSLKDTAALEEYLAPRLDIMGNRWSLGDASVSVQPAGSDAAVALATPAPPTALACDFGGYVWLLAGAKLYRLDPRGLAAWSNPAVSTAAEPATPAARGALALAHGGPLGSRAAPQRRLKPHQRRRPECWFGHSGPGYTDDGMARRECPGEAPTGCVGAYHGDGSSHEAWVEVALPEAPLALQPPRVSDHVIVTMPEVGPREVSAPCIA